MTAFYAVKIVLAITLDGRIILVSQSVLIAISLSNFGPKESNVNARKAVNTVQGFRRMIVKIAIETWKILPRQHQIWISVDDLVEDGMFEAYKLVTGTWYDSTKSALSTAIFHTVRKHLFNEYIKRYGNEMRFASLEGAGILDKAKRKGKGFTPAGMVSLDIPAGDRPIELPQLSTSEETIYNNVLTDCFVVPMLKRIYNEASSGLQEHMLEWFFDPKEKLHLKAPKFRRAVKEFRMLTRDHDLTFYDCEHLIHSPQCMNALSHELLAIPYDIEHPTPVMDKEL